jgi:hypothetical protein
MNHRNQYRPTENNFTALWHTANLLPDGNVMMVGGWRGDHEPSGQIDVFDAQAGCFHAAGCLRVARQYHRTVNLQDGRLLVTGGDAWQMGVASAEIIDPENGTTVETGAPVEGRSNHTATVLEDGRVLLVGGIGSSDERPCKITPTAETWDPEDGKFRKTAGALAVPRVGHAASLLPDGRVLIVGGWTTVLEYVLAEVFSPETESFSVVPNPDDQVRTEHSTLQLEDGSVLVLGGAADPLVLRFFADGSGAEILPALPEPRAVASAVMGPDGRAYLFGGIAGWGATATAEAYSPVHGSMAIASLPIARANHSVTRLADGRFLIAGGEDESNELVPHALIYE